MAVHELAQSLRSVTAANRCRARRCGEQPYRRLL
jgi:hypothetical protein